MRTSLACLKSRRRRDQERTDESGKGAEVDHGVAEAGHGGPGWSGREDDWTRGNLLDLGPGRRIMWILGTRRHRVQPDAWPIFC